MRHARCLEDVVTAAEELTLALVDLTDHGHTTPCQGRRRDRWTSDDAAEREWAAAVCVGLGCPVLVQCGASADEHDEKHHVWAGTDRTLTPPAKKRTPKERDRLMPRRNHRRPKRPPAHIEETAVEASPSTDRLAHLLVERGLASTAVLGPRPTYGNREATP